MNIASWRGEIITSLLEPFALEEPIKRGGNLNHEEFSGAAVAANNKAPIRSKVIIHVMELKMMIVLMMMMMKRRPGDPEENEKENVG